MTENKTDDTSSEDTKPKTQQSQDIDPDTGYEKGRAQRPNDLPFPDERIPTQTTTLEAPDGKGAFEDDVRPRSKDGTVEQPSSDVRVPVSPLNAARVLASDGIKVEDRTSEDEKNAGIIGNDPAGLSNPTDTVTKDEDMPVSVNTPVTDSRPNLAPTTAPTSQLSDESETDVDNPTETVTDKKTTDPKPPTKLDVRDGAPTENVPVEESTAKASSPEKTTTPKKTTTRRVRQ